MRRTRRILTLLVLVGIANLPIAALAQTSGDLGPIAWPEFRGPNGNGHAVATNLPAEFDAEKNCAWRIDLPGRGWSSPVITDQAIWVTTAIETEATAEEREQKLGKSAREGMSAYAKIELKVLRIDRASGQLTDTVDLFTVSDPPIIHPLNSFASPTPVINEEMVFVHFGTFGTAAINRKSKEVVWKTRDYPLEHEAGPGSSPMLYGDLLIVHCDGCDQQYVLALNAKTGKQVWKTDRSGELHKTPMYKKAFSTPVIVRRGEKDELISAGANWVYAYEPNTGKELWKISYGQLGFSNVARPIVKEDTLYVCSCFMKSKLMAIDISGTDPISESNVKWTYDKQVPNMPSPIEVNGNIYFSNDRGIATCVSASSGEKKWVARLGGGFSASPLLADGKIYFGNQEGQLFVINPNDTDLEIVATNQLDSAIMASPAAIGEALFVRTKKSLYRFQK